jgi:uncharacterized protein (TIGR02594 family)
MHLPNNFKHLADRKSLPKMLQIALDLHGLTETPGSKNNKVILDMAKKLKIDYKADSIPWCGLFMAYVASEAGYDYPNWPLAALNWKTFGMYSDQAPELGDILVFQREGGGHVGLYIAEDDRYYYVLGGNQGNMVSITAIDKKRLVRARRPIYKVGKSPAWKKFIVNFDKVKPSTNEK